MRDGFRGAGGVGFGGLGGSAGWRVGKLGVFAVDGSEMVISLWRWGNGTMEGRGGMCCGIGWDCVCMVCVRHFAACLPACLEWLLVAESVVPFG